MAKKIVIRNCYDCPHRGYTITEGATCSQVCDSTDLLSGTVHQPRKIRLCMGVPEWCPLEDAE